MGGESPPAYKRTQETRNRNGAAHLGIAYESYKWHYDRGERWCAIKKHWVPVERMGKRASKPEGIDNVCRRCGSEKSAARQRKITVLIAAGLHPKRVQKTKQPKISEMKKLQARIAELEEQLVRERCAHVYVDRAKELLRERGILAV